MKKDSTDRWLWVATVAICIIFADLVLILFGNGNLVYLPRELNTSDTVNFWAQRGQWGDMLSGHFAAMAFILLFYTAMLQRRELKEMREEAAQQTSEFKTQTTYMKYDRLFNQLRQYIDGIYIKKGTQERIKGYSALSEILDKSKRPASTSVNFSHIKKLIAAYISVVSFLDNEKDAKETLKLELGLVINENDIVLLWKIYICAQCIATGGSCTNRYKLIEKNNDYILGSEAPRRYFEEIKKSITDEDKNIDSIFINLYSELEG